MLDIKKVQLNPLNLLANLYFYTNYKQILIFYIKDYFSLFFIIQINNIYFYIILWAIIINYNFLLNINTNFYLIY